MTRKGKDGQVDNSHTHATRHILFIEKPRSELFYQFRPQGFLKMTNDWTGSMHNVCLRLLCQSIAFDGRFLCGYRLIIDWPIPMDTNELILSIDIDWLIDWFSNHWFPSIGYPRLESNKLLQRPVVCISEHKSALSVCQNTVSEERKHPTKRLIQSESLECPKNCINFLVLL